MNEKLKALLEGFYTQQCFGCRIQYSQCNNAPDKLCPHDVAALGAAIEEAGLLKPENCPKIICLCGSSRFIEHFAVMAWEFEKLGVICLGLHYLPANYKTQSPDHLAEAESVQSKMDELHLRKIDLADEVFILNVGGYIGDSTKRELAYARSKGKPVKWLEPDKAFELMEKE